MTNAIGTIRRFTETDAAALDAAALRFAKRHGLHLGAWGFTPRVHLEMELNHDNWQCKRLRRYWQACLCRALRVPISATITTGYGYVGYQVRT